MRTKTTKITEPQLAMLGRLRDMPEGNWFAVSGHDAGKCFKLAEKGFAKRQGGDGCLTSYYTITDAGRAFLNA